MSIWEHGVSGWFLSAHHLGYGAWMTNTRCIELGWAESLLRLGLAWWTKRKALLAGLQRRFSLEDIPKHLLLPTQQRSKINMPSKVLRLTETSMYLLLPYHHGVRLLFEAKVPFSRASSKSDKTRRFDQTLEAQHATVAGQRLDSSL